jgi:hypothetical protein
VKKEKYMTLKEVKTELRVELRMIKDSLRELKNEQCGIDRDSGHYAQTGKYDMKIALEGQYEITKRFLDLLTSVKKLK